MSKTPKTAHEPRQKENAYRVKSLEKALIILELMIDEERSLSLMQICARLGYGKSTVHRILGTLKQRKFVRQNPVTKLYGIGVRTLSIGSPSKKENYLRKHMTPFLRELHVECKETVNAAVNEYNQIKYIFRLESEEMLAFRRRRGPGSQFTALPQERFSCPF